MELHAELCRALVELQYFDVRHVSSAITYRAQVFLSQLETGLAKFEIWTW